MTRYENMLQTCDVEKALKRYNTDKAKLDADAVNFQPIDNMDIGEHYLVSYDMTKILPIAEILWIRFIEMWGRKAMWTFVSDGYSQILFIEDENNIDTIVKMLRERNRKLIYGSNDDLRELVNNNVEQFCKLIAQHPGEDAANIKVDPSLLPVPEEEVPEAPVENVQNTEEDETPYTSPEEMDIDTVAVPEDLDFSEEMKLFLHLAKTYPDDAFLTLYEPVSASSIDEFEARNNVKLTDELKRLFLFTDGFEVSAGSTSIYSLELIEHYLSVEWEWGDTKNYMCIGDMIGDGEMIFLDLDSGNIITNDHGEETDYGDLTTLLFENISIFLDGEYDDEELDEYLGKSEEMDE